LADIQRTVYPHKWSPVSCKSSAGQRKFAGPITVPRNPPVPAMCHNLRRDGGRGPPPAVLTACTSPVAALIAGSEARYRLRIAISVYPTCIRRPHWGAGAGSRRIIAMPFGVDKLEWLKKIDDMLLLVCFDRIHERDGHTRAEKQTDTRTHTCRETNRHTDTHMQRNKQTHGHRHAEKQTDTRTHTCRETNRHTDTHVQRNKQTPHDD